MSVLIRARTTVATTGRWLRRRASRGFRREQCLVRAGVQLPELPRVGRVRGQVWAVSMVKNELDILPEVVAHLHEQGVDRILIADNGSSDGTLEYLLDAEGYGTVAVARDSVAAYYQAHKMTLLAQAARRAGADWIVPFDADEFWFGVGEPLGDVLRASDADVLTAELYNVFPRPSEGWQLDLARHWHGKVCFRAHVLADLAQGNHFVDRPGPRDTDGSVVAIAHYPWRSFEQFVGKVRQGAAAYAAIPKASVGAQFGEHWRSLAQLSDTELAALWAGMLQGKAVEGMHWQPAGPFLESDPRTWSTWPGSLSVCAGDGGPDGAA